jgi:hypothetical protein
MNLPSKEVHKNTKQKTSECFTFTKEEEGGGGGGLKTKPYRKLWFTLNWVPKTKKETYRNVIFTLNWVPKKNIRK